MEFYQKNFILAQEKIKKIENLIVLSQVSKNKRLALITLEEIEKALKHCISSMLHYDYLLKRIKVSKDPILNLKIFESKSSKNYEITNQELRIIKEILNTAKDHQQSPMEFVRNQEIIILTDNHRITKISIQKLTNFASTTKNILNKIKIKIDG